MSKFKIQMKITDNGHGTRTRSSNAVCRPPSSVLIITSTNNGHETLKEGTTVSRMKDKAYRAAEA